VTTVGRQTDADFGGRDLCKTSAAEVPMLTGVIDWQGDIGSIEIGVFGTSTGVWGHGRSIRRSRRAVS
jgi:hypothetical protein